MANSSGADFQALGAVEGKIDLLIDLVAEVRKDQKDVAAKAVELATRMGASANHEDRISALERDKSYVKGWIAAAAGIGGLAGAIVGWLASFLAHAKA